MTMNIDGLQEYNNLLSKVREAQDVLSVTLKEFLCAEFIKLQNKYPFLDWITWEQWTPSFADGDVPEFSVHELKYKINYEFLEKEVGIDPDLVDSDEENLSFDQDLEWLKRYYSGEVLEAYSKLNDYYNKNKEYIDNFYKDFEKLSTLLTELDSDLLKYIFGDQAKIVITLDGLIEEECWPSY